MEDKGINTNISPGNLFLVSRAAADNLLGKGRLRSKSQVPETTSDNNLNNRSSPRYNSSIIRLQRADSFHANNMGNSASRRFPGQNNPVAHDESANLELPKIHSGITIFNREKYQSERGYSIKLDQRNSSQLRDALSGAVNHINFSKFMKHLRHDELNCEYLPAGSSRLGQLSGAQSKLTLQPSIFTPHSPLSSDPSALYLLSRVNLKESGAAVIAPFTTSIIDRQRESINQMIAKSRAQHVSSLIIQEYCYDQGKLEDMEKSLRKKISLKNFQQIPKSEGPEGSKVTLHSGALGGGEQIKSRTILQQSSAALLGSLKSVQSVRVKEGTSFLQRKGQDEQQIEIEKPAQPPQIVIDPSDDYETFQDFVHKIIQRLDNQDDGKPDIGIWDPKYNVKKGIRKLVKFNNMGGGSSVRARSMLRDHKSVKMTSIFDTGVVGGEGGASKNRSPSTIATDKKLTIEIEDYMPSVKEPRIGKQAKPSPFKPINTLDGRPLQQSLKPQLRMQGKMPLASQTPKPMKFNFPASLRSNQYQERITEQMKSKSTIHSFQLISPKGSSFKKKFKKGSSDDEVEDESDNYENDVDDRLETKIDLERYNQMQATFQSNLAQMQHQLPVSFGQKQEKPHSQEEIQNVIRSLIDMEVNNAESSGLGSPTKSPSSVYAKIAQNIANDLNLTSLAKNAFTPKLLDDLRNDIRHKYFMNCRAEIVNMLPLLSKIQNRVLNLTNYVMSGSVAKALSSSIQNQEIYFNRIILDCNGLKDEDFACILEGLKHLQEIKSIIYIKNDFMTKSIDALKPLFSLKNVPLHLEELRLVNCGKISSLATQRVLDAITEKSYLKKLSLVAASMNDDICIQKLTKLLKTSRQLIELDISWNRIKQSAMSFEFFETLGENRQLQHLNLSWNILMDKSDITVKRGGPGSLIMTEQEANQHILDILAKQAKLKPPAKLASEDMEYYFVAKIIRFIKYNRTLQYLDLSHTGLNELGLRAIAIALRRAKSIISLHLSGNVGVTKEIKDYLFGRIRCAQTLTSMMNTNDEVQIHINQANQQAFDRAVHQIIDQYTALKDFVAQNLELIEIQKQMQSYVQITETEDIDLQRNDRKLFFTRFLGYKKEIPGSAQWVLQEAQSSEASCWVRNRWIYAFLLWSRDIGMRTEILIDQDAQGKIMEQVKLINFDNQLYQGNNTTDPKQPPLICGTFTSWKFKQFKKLSDFCNSLDTLYEVPDYLEILKQRNRVREEVQSYKRLDKEEKYQYKKLEAEFEQKRKSVWKETILKYTKFKKPLFVNSNYVNISSDVDQELFKKPTLNQSGENVITEQSPSNKKQNFDLIDSTLGIDDNNEIYILPVFLRPGRHSYFVRTCHEEAEQIYVHRLIAPHRDEDIPLSVKESKISVVQRKFKKDASVFRDWKEDTPISLGRALECDLKAWKASRFIKDYEEVERCTKIASKYFSKLKDIFISLSCQSSFPNITQIDYSMFCDSCQFLDANVNFATIDRLFIATNYEVIANEENPDRALQRFELIEVLLRIANAKYREPGIVSSYSEAFEKLLKTNVFPNYQPSPWQEFRDKELWTIDVNDTLEANFNGLMAVYSKFFESRKRYMTMKDALDLLMKLTPLNMIEKNAIYCYGMCKMTIIDEQDDSIAKYNKLQWVEFLEMIGRVADLKFKGTELEIIPLAEKINFVMDDLLTFVNQTRQDVVIDVEEYSESDDDY